MAALNNRPTLQRLIIIAAVCAGLAGLAVANGYLVSAALRSQPPCVDHLKTKGEAPGDYRAAKPSC